MKVLCIGKCPVKHNHRDLIDAYNRIKIGEIYTVIDTVIKRGQPFYELSEFPHPLQILWEAECFAPISEIDETEMIRNYSTVSA